MGINKKSIMFDINKYNKIMNHIDEHDDKDIKITSLTDTDIFSEPPPLISGEQKSNGGLVHLYLKGFDESKRVSDTKLLEGLLTVLSFTLFSPGYAVRFPKLSARQRPKPMPIGR